MDNPIIVAAVIGLLSTIAAAIIGLIGILVRRGNGNPGNATKEMLKQLEGHVSATQRVADRLGDIRDDLAALVRENREAHDQQNRALTTMLERLRR